MRTRAVVLALLCASTPDAVAQVLVQIPPGVVASINCDLFPIFPSVMRIRYRMLNVRPGSQDGTFLLFYKPAHANEGPLDVPYKARFLSADVDVSEEYSDMGVWIMRENFGKLRWAGRCVRLSNGLKVVYGIGIFGNLQQIEPYDPGGDCDDPTQVLEDPYDPYDPSPGEDDCAGGGGGGGGSSGSGIQYEPGDHTGGETVDWNTGAGNGGSSACGATAVVEYVCIDAWDGGEWVEWDCGYATTC